MSRYRIRFQLQEIDLAPGETLLGRSPECHVTIEDPLVSRRHARILIKGDQTSFEDLGSRNGSRVNGTPVRGTVVLNDNDRLRIGTQELVFCRVAPIPTRSANRITGYLLYCASCRFPYPEEMLACPNCGARERVPEETTLAASSDGQTSSWAILLLAEVIERAVQTKHLDEAERAAKRARAAVDERLSQTAAFDATPLDALSSAICSYIGASDDDAWLSWLLRSYARSSVVPSTDVVGRIRSRIPTGSTRLQSEVDEVLVASLSRSAAMGQSELDGRMALQRWSAEAQRSSET